jgi:hypothetical protein
MLAGPGAQVVVPPGALTQNTMVSIAVVQDGYPTLPPGTALLSNVLAFQPHGQVFAEPVTVTVGFTSRADLSPSLITASPGGAWTAVPASTISGASMQASVVHFSFFAVAGNGNTDGGVSDAASNDGPDDTTDETSGAGGSGGNTDGATAAAGAAGGGSGSGAMVGTGGTGGTVGASGTGCGFPMPNPASTGLPNPAAYTKNADGTVTDNVTGLTWEGTITPGLKHTPLAPNAQEHCANEAPAGSWRLPTRLELVSLVDFTVANTGQANPATIDQMYFPNTSTGPYWTSSAFAGGSANFWAVTFSDGKTSDLSVLLAGNVRCVLVATPKCYPERYQVQGGGLVLDDTTGLTWQQTVDPGEYTWSAAMAYCAGLGAGWRAPSLTELQTIVDDSRLSPAIDGTAFPNTPLAPLWTSSADATHPGYAWYVSFADGTTNTSFDVAPNSNPQAPDTTMVRCVR